MNQEEQKRHNEFERMLVENCFTGKIPENKLKKIIHDIQKRQEEILDRKYVSEEELKRSVVYAHVKDTPVRSLANPVEYARAS